MSAFPEIAPPIRFNPFAREFVRNPYPFYHTLQRDDPYHRSHGALVLTRYADVKQALSSQQLSSAAIPDLVHAFQAKTGSTDLHRLYELGRKAIVFTDRPEHARLRRLVGRCFTRDKLEKLDGLLSGTALAQVRRFEETGGDFVAGLAGPFCMQVLLGLLGLPLSDAAKIDSWTTSMRYLLEPSFLTPQRLVKIYRLLEECFGYMRDVVHTRRANPGEDLVSDLLRHDANDDALDDDEVVYSCIMVFVAGKETTKCLLGNGLHALLSFPHEYARLRDDIAQLPAAIQEMLRFDSPLQQTKRVCREACRIGDETVSSGEALLLCLGAANRDPGQFPDPDRFDSQRTQTANLALGHGMHNCLGTQLSKLMTSHLFGALIPRWRSFALVDADPPRINSSFILRGFHSLRIEVTRG